MQATLCDDCRKVFNPDHETELPGAKDGFHFVEIEGVARVDLGLAAGFSEPDLCAECLRKRYARVAKKAWDTYKQTRVVKPAPREPEYFAEPAGDPIEATGTKKTDKKSSKKGAK